MGEVGSVPSPGSVTIANLGPVTTAGRPRLHPAWTVAAVAFVALVGAAGFRATPGVLIEPLHHEVGWSTAALTVGGAALLVVPLVAVFLRERPTDLGLLPYGATVAVPAPVQTLSPVRAALDALRFAAGTRAFWLLAGGFAICGATTNGLVGTHFIPAAHDHGMGVTTAAGPAGLLRTRLGSYDVA